MPIAVTQVQRMAIDNIRTLDNIVEKLQVYKATLETVATTSDYDTVTEYTNQVVAKTKLHVMAQQFQLGGIA